MNTELLDKAGHAVSDVVSSATQKLPALPHTSKRRSVPRTILALIGTAGAVVLLVLVGSRLARGTGSDESEGNASKIDPTGNAFHTGALETVDA